MMHFKSNLMEGATTAFICFIWAQSMSCKVLLLLLLRAYINVVHLCIYLFKCVSSRGEDRGTSGHVSLLLKNPLPKTRLFTYAYTSSSSLLNWPVHNFDALFCFAENIFGIFFKTSKWLPQQHCSHYSSQAQSLTSDDDEKVHSLLVIVSISIKQGFMRLVK